MKMVLSIIVGLVFLSTVNIRASAQVSEAIARQQVRDIVRSKLNLRAEQFLDIKRDEELEQSLRVSSKERTQPDLIFKLSSTGYEIKEKAVVHHLSTDGDLTYIVALSPMDGSIFRIRGFPDSQAEFEKLIMAAKVKVLSLDQAEALVDFYREVNPENRSIAPISSMFDLKQAAERQCQTIPFDVGDRQFEMWWKKAKTLYAGVPFSQTAVPRDGGYLVGWTVVSSPGAGACAGAPLRVQLEVNSDGHIGDLSFLPLRPGQH